SFTASVSGNTVTLNWATATELNNDGFEVQRSTAENVWEKIAFIAGNGTTTEERNYSFIDNNLAVGQYSYRLKQIDFDGTSELSDVVNVEVINPAQYALSQNYPNPFNPSTTINFTLPEASNVTLKIFNTLGEEVSVLVNRVMEAGTHNVNFDASQLQSGIYFYRLEAGTFNQVRKMTLLK
ncbi:MAG: T9SS type A sorting domain-containing protein, partial [Ignavibacterium sp.]